MSDYIWGRAETKFFLGLTPDIILSEIDKLGFKTTGRCLSLASMENRVYEIEIERVGPIHSENDRFIIAKFYRPSRWSKEQILEEHEFLEDLQEEEIPVVAPISFDGQTLFETREGELFFALFERRGGRAPIEMNDSELQILGRQIARMHIIGSQKKAKHRLELNSKNFGEKNLESLLSSKSIPMYFESQYKACVNELILKTKNLLDKTPKQRIHGDCHWGNILFRDSQMVFIDFDDMLTGPCVQDLWLILPFADDEGLRQRDILLEAYESMKHFDDRELSLIEPLRALRFIHFSAWISKRWEDHSFKRAFPHYGSDEYWREQIRDLEDQLRLIG